MKRMANTDGGNISGEEIIRHNNEATGSVYLMTTYE